MDNRKKNQKGVSIVEVLGVMTVMMIIASLSYMSVVKSREYGLRKKFEGFSGEVERKVYDYHSFYRDNADLDNAALLKAGVFDLKACQGSSVCPTPQHPQQGAVVVLKTGDDLQIIYSLVPRKTCANLLDQEKRYRAKVVVNGVEIPMKNGLSELGRACKDKNTVTVTLIEP